MYTSLIIAMCGEVRKDLLCCSLQDHRQIQVWFCNEQNDSMNFELHVHHRNYHFNSSMIFTILSFRVGCKSLQTFTAEEYSSAIINQFISDQKES